ncbi:hypothetical protein BTO32_14800 [Marinobacter lutaoensis]|uniref:Uncharacterized protein n=1 Tax=Marinobacter lutaoensis TaxID=135739 RepID=A0A1V2DPQ1_9GAMM|nr:hypothetical protein [Marinobacter lutaoensis]ONF42480.1 hypothetical protein BTO32_14800 [Marinobacter lutaoensis]
MTSQNSQSRKRDMIQSIKHWSDRLKTGLRDTARFIAEFGYPLGCTTLGVMGVCAVTAGVMGHSSEHPLVAEELKAMAVVLGATGMATSGPLIAIGAWCEQLMEKLDIKERQNAVWNDEMHSGDASTEIIRLMSTRERRSLIEKIVKGTPAEATFHRFAGENERLSRVAHGIASSDLQFGQNSDVRMTPA